MRSVDGVPCRLEGVEGKGTAKSRSFLLGDFDGDLEARVGEPGGCGAARMEEADGDFGDDDARRRVKFEGFATEGSAGKSARGICGIAFSFSCSCERKGEPPLLYGCHVPLTLTHFRSLTRTSLRLASLSAVQRATAAMPPFISLSMSISTSIPSP